MDASLFVFSRTVVHRSGTCQTSIWILMKKLIPMAAVVATAMIAFTLTAVEKQSSMDENPLLSANVEALSAAEMVAPNVLDLGSGTYLYLHMVNKFDREGNPMNICVPDDANGCILNAGHLANGKVDVAALASQLISRFNFNLDLTKLLSKFKALIKQIK